MAKYTISIRELIEANKGDDDPSTLEGIHDIAERVLFGEELNVINDEYVDRFITGFALHYFNDEIGYETYPMWRIALMEKVFNNAELINGVYENLDKQIFSDYRTRKVANKSNKIDSIATVGTSDTASSSEGATSRSNTGTQSNEHTGTTGVAESGSDNLKRGGTDKTTHGINEVHGKSGSDTTVSSGNRNSSLARSGADTVEHTGSETDAASGIESYDKSGSLDRTVAGNKASSGSETLNETTNVDHGESGSYRDTTNYGKTDTTNTESDKNAIQITFDTPMGSLENMRTPDTTLRGEGVSAAASTAESGTHSGGGRTYNYMTGAIEDDSSDIGKNVSTASGSDYTERTFNGYKTDDDTTVASRRANGQVVDEKTVTSDTDSEKSSKATSNTNTKTHNTADSTQYGSKEATAESDSNNSEVQYNTTESRSGVNTDATEFGGTEARESARSSTNVYDERTTRSDNLNEASVNKNSGNVTTNTGSNTSGVSDVTGEVDEQDLHFNYEMFMKADIMMSRIWDLFDPIFFMILDTY